VSKYVRAGWAFLSVGGFILFIFLVNDLPNACLYPPTPSPFPNTQPLTLRCWLVYVHLPEIIISVAMIITGIVLRSLGHKKVKKI